MILSLPTIAQTSRLNLVSKVSDYLKGEVLSIEVTDANDHKVESFELTPDIYGVWRLDIIAEVSTHNDEVYNSSAHVTILDDEGQEVVLSVPELFMLSDSATENISII